MKDSQNKKQGKSKVVRYNKWGYIFLAPFVIVYLVFQLVPLLNTIYSSFFENYYAMGGLVQVGPNFVGLDNYKTIFSTSELFKYTENTLIMWIIGFVPQIIVSLMLAQWFSDVRLKLRCSGFFKTVIYLPNLIMASAFSMLFFALFSDTGPINAMLVNMGIIDEPFRFFASITASRGLVGFMNFLMWFGNTTILLMAGIMGIDVSLFEAAEVDGASSWKRFTKITLPLLKPILIYVVITSMIGGIQMFDVPQILTKGEGTPVESTMTLIMYLNKHLYSKNYGMGGALSVFLFVVTAILSLIIYSFMYRDTSGKAKKKVK
ncbi:MAG: carbohydrate ABC transporter permease [Lachnospiraceae bacterium]